MATEFDTSRDSCACGQVDLGGLAGDGWVVGQVVVEGLDHGLIACLRHDAGQ